MALSSALFLSPDYQSHRLHADPLHGWPEHNCYVDMWIELLHVAGCDPMAMLYHTLAMEFRADQWTFFKPEHTAIRRLYGIDVYEVDVWGAVEAHVTAHIKSGSVPLLEVDAFYLPDLAATSYRSEHTKTGIGIVAIDPEARELRYVHNRGLFSAAGEDYAGLLGVDRPPLLVPYMEAASLANVVRKDHRQLRDESLGLLEALLRETPPSDPFPGFSRHLNHSLQQIAGGELDYNAYAFPTFRQLGAASALGAEYLEWAEAPGRADAVDALRRISDLTQSCILKLARAARGREVDYVEALAAMSEAWSTVQHSLRETLTWVPSS
ncbi:MAG: DUF1839 family protein [Chloroflexi bacterium]|nr:DUF1839 family protein [Chloroflexota bacterium]